MLKDVIKKAGFILKDAQQRLPLQSADTVENVYVSIENLNSFINKEMDRIERNPNLSDLDRSGAQRGVIEQAGRKLEQLKDRSNYSDLIQETDVEIPEAYEKDENILLKFMREREIRDRLFGMTEAQILSHFGESLFNGGNQLLLNAIINAPAGFEMLSEHNLRKLRRLKAESLTKNAGAKPQFDRTANASIVEIFSLVKKELDRLRKLRLAGSRARK
ncbi:MAG: hypothetical protein GY850_35290 [bacterium]|nr:hypothetical protein [bacterium]